MERQNKLNETSEIKIDKSYLFKLVKEYKELYKSIPDNDNYKSQRMKNKNIYLILDNILMNEGLSDLYVKLEYRKKIISKIGVKRLKLEANVKETLDWYYLNATGYRKNNGGFANTLIRELEIKDNYIKVDGYVEYGKDDTGDGTSTKYSDKITIYLGKKTNPAETPIPAFEYYILTKEETEKAKKIFDDE